MMKNKIHYVPFFLITAQLFAQDDMPTQDRGMWQTLVMIAIAVVFFYFILYRPEQQRRKVLEQQRSALKKGDRVTAMGILGTVSKIDKDTVILQMVDGAKIEVLKGAITDVQSSQAES